MAVKVVTDSTSCIPVLLRKEFDISTISLSVNFSNGSVLEEEIDNETFYERLSREKSLPTSSQPCPSHIYKLFERFVNEGDSVVGIFISSKMSGTYSTALAVKNMILEKYPDGQIEIIDSGSNSMELGFAVLAAAKAAKNGRKIEEVVQEAEKVIKRSRFLFVPESLEYLRKGGRIGGAASLLGSILQIKPILTVVDGNATVFSKVRTRAKAIQKIVDQFVLDIHDKKLGEVIVHHINDEAKGKELARMIEEKIGRAVSVYPVGPVIGLHVGPGTVGLVYYTL